MAVRARPFFSVLLAASLLTSEALHLSLSLRPLPLLPTVRSRGLQRSFCIGQHRLEHATCESE